MNVLVVYSHFSSHVNTTREYLESFQLMRGARVQYLNVIQPLYNQFNLHQFDVVILSYCARLCIPHYVDSHFLNALKDYKGIKVACIQDEYDNVNLEVEQLRYVGIDLILTCVPAKYWNYVYPKSKLPDVKLRQVLTGYVSRNIQSKASLLPLSDRPIAIGYRGRKLSAKYGKLGELKFNIGVEIKKRAIERGIPNVDIEWSEEKRLYGPSWGQWLGRVRTTLVTESGSNVFDFDGSIEKAVSTAERNGEPIAPEILDLISLRESEVCMNQISPRVFEAIASGCCLIAFEGNYSGILQPGRHYISLKKDFSNIDAVLDSAMDLDLLSRMFETTYQEVILNSDNTYQGFANVVMSEVQNVIKDRGVEFTYTKSSSVSDGKFITDMPLIAKVKKNTLAFRIYGRLRYYLSRLLKYYPKAIYRYIVAKVVR